MSHPVRIFVSYAHADEAYRKRLDAHLAPLDREGLIAVWHDRMISPGTVWTANIDDNLSSADIVLLLVSADFVASDYCVKKEMLIAMQRHHTGDACVIPIFIRPTDFGRMPFAALQGLPRDAKPVSQWADADEAWLDVAKGIRRAVEASRTRTAKPVPPSVVTTTLPLHPPYDDSFVAGMSFSFLSEDKPEESEPILRPYFSSLGIGWDVISFYRGRLDFSDYLRRRFPPIDQATIEWFDVGLLFAFIVNRLEAYFTDPKLRSHFTALTTLIEDKLQKLLRPDDYKFAQELLQQLLSDRARKIDCIGRLSAFLRTVAPQTTLNEFHNDKVTMQEQNNSGK